MTEARARIAAIGAVIARRLDSLSSRIFPTSRPPRRETRVQDGGGDGDIDYGDDDDLEESAREDHVAEGRPPSRPRRPLVLKASLSAALIGALSAALVDVMPTSWARKRRAMLWIGSTARIRRRRGRWRRRTRRAADAAADAELGLSQGGLVDLARGKQAMRWATPRASHRERRPRDVVHRRGDAQGG